MSSSTLITIRNYINLYGYSLVMTLGNIGNIFIMILFSRQRHNACSIYILNLAIINNLYLTFNSLARIISYDFRNKTIGALAYCKIRSYLSGSLGGTAKTVIVLACIDRYMMTSTHTNFRAFSTPKRAQYLIFFSFIFWLIAGCHIPIMTTISNGQCIPSGVYSAILSIYIIISIALFPPITSGIFSYLTYRNMRQRNLRVQAFKHNTNDVNIPIRRRDRDLLILVISELILYAVTTIPYPLIFSETIISRYIIPNKSVQYSQIEALIFTIVYLLVNVNHGASFYVYLVLSKSFRRDWKQLITNGYRKLGRQPRTVATIRTNQKVIQQETSV